MSLNYYTIGQRIREIRKRCGFSQAMLSELVDKSPTYISYIEGGSKSMSLETFVQIANALEVSTDLLLIDHLTSLSVAGNREVTKLLADCSDYETLVLLDTLKMLKIALRDHQHRFGKSRNTNYTSSF